MPFSREIRVLIMIVNTITTILPPEEGDDFDVELVLRDGRGTLLESSHVLFT
jgi:hypothetical protein